MKKPITIKFKGLAINLTKPQAERMGNFDQFFNENDTEQVLKFRCKKGVMKLIEKPKKSK